MTTPYRVWHRDRMCTRKKALPSEYVARNFAWLVEVSFGSAMDIYQCTYCHDWHLCTRLPGDKRSSKVLEAINDAA